MPLALSSALPTLARAATGAREHVCHCKVIAGESTCACPICNPDRDDCTWSDEAIRGRCGDEDECFGAALGFAVVPASCASVIRATDVGQLDRTAPPPLQSVDVPPLSPPPKLAAI
jgi:hypothetical protein